MKGNDFKSKLRFELIISGFFIMEIKMIGSPSKINPLKKSLKQNIHQVKKNQYIT